MGKSCPPPQSEATSAEKLSFPSKLVLNSRRILLGTLRLRRVQVALVTILVTLLIVGFPMLESLREQLLMIFAAVLMVALGGYTVNDAFSNGHEEPPQERLEALLEDLVEELRQDDELTELLMEEEEEKQVYDAEA
jgi:hypothetical protein